MMTAPRMPWAGVRKLQGRKSREMWRTGASEATGISALAVYCEVR
jgi:hypothetical protein